MYTEKYLLVIAGPTASGKTSWSIQLAQQYKTVILSADSRQFYRQMSIGTAKPTPEELAQAPHYFIDSQSIEAAYSVGDYEREALALLEKCFQEHDLVLLVGGSGLFVQAVCEGFDAFPEVPPDIRESLNRELVEQGLESLQAELAQADPEYYAQVDRQNPKRVIRALEVCRATGKPYSHFRQQNRAPRPFQTIYLFSHWPRPRLYQRIEQRVDQMMEQGLLEEVKRLLPYRHHNALQTVGYQELFAHLEGKTNLEEAVELIKRNSRRFAKRQMTWNRRLGYGKHFHPSEHALIATYLSWTMAHRCQFFWQKEEEAGFFSLGWKSLEGKRAVLRIEKRKRDYLIVAIAGGQKTVDPPLQFLLLHELWCKFPGEKLTAILPASWHPTLGQMGFEKVGEDWVHPQ